MSGLKSSIVRLTPMYRRVLGVALCLAFIAAGYKFGIAPMDKSVAAEQSKQKQTNAASIAMYQQIKVLEKDIDAHVKLEQSHISRLEGQGRRLYTRSELVSLFERMPGLAAAAGLRGFEAREDPAASGGAVLAIVNPAAVKEYVTVSRISAKVKFTSGYSGLARFVQSLKSEKAFIRLSSLDVKSVDYSADLQTEAVFNFYYIEGN